MKLQPESKKELLRIAGGTAFCTVVLWVLFAALHLVGWVRFDYTVILGSLVGAAVAVGNFAGICFVVQKIIDEDIKDGEKLHIEGTPFFLINNLVIRGAVPKDIFRRAIEIELNAAR